MAETTKEEYERLIADTPDDGLSGLIDRLLDPTRQASLVVARPVISQLIKRISKDEALLSQCLEKLTPQASSFEEQISAVREALATKLEQEQAFLEAARVLQGLSLESGGRQVSDDYKLRTYIRIVRCLLEEDQAVDADAYLSRATALMHTAPAAKEDAELQLHFKLSQARVLDAKRKFQDAAARYLELSHSALIAEEERLKCLEASITCAVLAPAGARRSRVLGQQYRDDRRRQLPNVCAALLEKMYLGRLVTPEEVVEFETTLRPHQRAIVSDLEGDTGAAARTAESGAGDSTGSGSSRVPPTTVLTRAVVEHNVLALSNLYENVRIADLGDLLRLQGSPGRAERVVREMITNGRLNAALDQVDAVLYLFDSGNVAFEAATAPAEADADATGTAAGGASAAGVGAVADAAASGASASKSTNSKSATAAGSAAGAGASAITAEASSANAASKLVDATQRRRRDAGDQNVHSLLTRVEEVASEIERRFPELLVQA